MYTKEQEEIALREYERLGSIAAVIRRLGYPSESTLYRKRKFSQRIKKLRLRDKSQGRSFLYAVRFYAYIKIGS